jgi:hypothetical protein
MEFKIQTRNGIPNAIFEEDGFKYYLLWAFLEQARTMSGSIYLDMLEQAEQSQYIESTRVVGLTGDHVDVDFYSNQVLITELYPEDEDEPRSVSLLLKDAKELLLKWQDALRKWHEREV